MREKRVGFVGVLGGSSSTTSENSTGEGTVSRSVRSDVCHRSDALCFCNATVGGEFDEQSGSRERRLKYNRETLRKETSGVRETHLEVHLYGSWLSRRI